MHDKRYVPAVAFYRLSEFDPLHPAKRMRLIAGIFNHHGNPELFQLFHDLRRMGYHHVFYGKREDVETEKTAAFFFVTANGLIQVRQSSDYIPKMIELAGGKYVFENLGDPGTRRSTMNIQVE